MRRRLSALQADFSPYHLVLNSLASSQVSGAKLMSKRTAFAIFVALSSVSTVVTVSAQTNLSARTNAFQPQPAAAVVESDRTKDGLTGPVRRVRTEIVKLSNETGKSVEGKRSLI